MYDVSNMKSFENLRKWIEISKNYNIERKVRYAVLGNKSKYSLGMR